MSPETSSITMCPLTLEMFLQTRVVWNLDCVIHNAIVSFAVFEPEPAPREAGHARRLLRVDEDLVRSRINNDLGGFNAFPGLAVFEGFDGHFVAVPAGDFNPAVDIVEAEPAIGGERERPVEVLLKLILRQKVAEDFCFLDMEFTPRSGSHRLRRHGRAGLALAAPVAPAVLAVSAALVSRHNPLSRP